MKTKLTITIEADIVPKAKRYAARQGVSLSHLIESAMRGKGASDTESFSARWRGKLRPSDRHDDERHRHLVRKYP